MDPLDRSVRSYFSSRLLLLAFFSVLCSGLIGYYIANSLDKNYVFNSSQEVHEAYDNSGLSVEDESQDQTAISTNLDQYNTDYNQNSAIEDLSSSQSSLKRKLTALDTDGNSLKLTNYEFSLLLDGTTLSQSESGLKVSDGFYNDHVRASSNAGGDLSGIFSALQVTDDSHNHTGSTISDLTTSDFISSNISQWTNNSGYLTSANGFVQNGNSFGGLATFGTNDNNGLAFETNGTEAMRILSDGHVGIGTTTPTEHLSVNDPLTGAGLVATFARNNKKLGLYSNSTTFNIGTETDNGLGFYTNQSSAQMVLDTSGRLGIGTTNPGARLEINSGILGNAGLKFTQLNSSTATAFTNGKVLTLDASGNLTWAVDQVGGSAGVLPSGTNGQTLYNNGVSWVATSNLYNTGGRIGIGTTSPQNMLHIYGTDNSIAGPYDIQKNGITIDGVSDGDKFLSFAEEGVSKWNMGMYRDENGRNFYLENNESHEIPLTVTAAGRVGINTPANVMNYHDNFVGAGNRDTDVGGVYTGEFQRYYEVEIDGNGVADTYRWRTSWDNLNWDSWTSGVTITGTEQDLNSGITFKFAETTGHIIGDKWSFAAYSQNPRGSFTIGPGAFREVLYYDGSGFTDNTYNANYSGAAPMDLLTDTNDYTYFGRLIPFGSIYLNLPQVATNVTLVAEYWNGAAWTPLTVGANNLRDNTSNLTETGTIDFDRGTLTNWSKKTVSDYVDMYYWIRISTSTSPFITPKFDVATPNSATRLGVYASSLDTSPIFSVDAIGHTIVGDGLEVTGIAQFASQIQAGGGVQLGVGQSYSGLGAVTVNSADGTVLSLDSGTTGALNIGTGANAKTITMGNVTGTTGIFMNSGSGDINLNPTVNDTHISGGYGATGVTVSNLGGIQANGALTVDGVSTLTGLVTATGGVSIGAAAMYTGAGVVTLSSANDSNLNVTSGLTGDLNLDSGTTGAVNLGTGASAKTITIGNATGVTSLTLASGSGNITINPAGNSTLISGGYGSTGLTVSAAGNVSTNGTLTVDGISTLTGQLTASGGISVAAGQAYTGAGAVNVSSAATTALSLDSGTTGALNIGTGASAKTITIGNITAGTALAFKAGTGAIDVSSSSIGFKTNGATAFSLNSSGDGALTGDLTITGNNLYMASNLLGSILVADGSKYNPVVMSGDAMIAADGALTINYLAAQSADTTNKGFLTAADWNTFFNKQAALGYTAEDAANKSTDIVVDGASDTKYATAKAVKSYADNLAMGLNWKNPSELINAVGDSASPIGSPVNLDGYIIKTGGNTGAWSTFAAGDLVQYQGSSWVKIKSMVVGDHFGVAYRSSTVPSGGMLGKKNYLAQVTGGTPGAYTYTFTAPSNNDAVYVENVNAYYHNVSFVYSSSLTEWVQLSAAVDYSFGNGLQTTGTAVSLGNLTTDWTQSGAFNINTAGDIGVNGGGLTTTAATASLFNANATTLDIGGAATAINLGASGVVVAGAGDLTLKSGTASALTLDSGTTGALNLGTGASAKVITIGNTTGATSLTLDSGSGNISLNPTSNSTLVSGGYGSTGVTFTSAGNISANGTLTIDGVSTLTGLASGTAGFSVGSGQSYTGAGAVTLSSGSATALTVDSGTTGALNLGTGASAKTIIVGNNTGATSLTLTSGSGNVSINSAANDTLISGGYSSTGLTVTSAGNVSTNGTLTVDGVSTLTGQLTATGGISVAAGQSYTGAGAVTLSSGAGTALTVDSGTTGALNLGTGASAKTITIGSSSTTAVKIANLTTQYGVLYAGTTDGSLVQTAAGTTGQCLIGNTGAAPSWGSCVTGAAFTKTGTNLSPTTSGDDLLLNSGETLTIGGGTAITKHLSATASLNFPSIANNSCSSLTITVTGAAVGDSVTASPSAVAQGIETFVNTSWNAYVSATNTVTVRACKINTGTVDPNTQTWRADVWQH